MFKGVCISGTYRNEYISVSATLENPADFNLDPATLVFSVSIKTKRSGVAAPIPEDFTFYIMDEANRIYNMQSSSCLTTFEVRGKDEEPEYQPDLLIYTGFRPDFIFQDLWILLCYRPDMSFNILKLNG